VCARFWAERERIGKRERVQAFQMMDAKERKKERKKERERESE
jgi:hypothetical protein